MYMSCEWVHGYLPAIVIVDIDIMNIPFIDQNAIRVRWGKKFDPCFKKVDRNYTYDEVPKVL